MAPVPSSSEFRYPFAPALKAHLARCTSFATFRFGDWLATLTDEALADFQDELDLFAHDTAAVRRHCREAAWVLLMAEAMEHRVTRPVTPTKDIGHLVLRAVETVTIEKLRRKGWVYVEGRLTLRHRQVRIHPTAYGLAQQRRISAGDRASFAA
ncbi:MAG: hypothetical protein U1F48_06710 [Burkholderiales bacterium]